ncbi:flagellin [Cohaesibacter sp. ES.047]|uniref:flagellin N-terminal helical domain-containing protein n=1 Tax=Cohaesibacter sp. ES.047 TaxID=1798205 RepID=UPI000BC05DDC|nr:flagellin [Cohaesibacter sp. ES.047]SNY91758.1 flagellin [Cohaesibacter sp. ES.047]
MPVISTNTAANTAVRFLNINANEQSNSLAKLASGSNINKASDDAAGLAIATKISSDVAALEQASTNSSHGISVLQTADGGASNIADIVERMKVLASQSASGTVTAPERAYIQAEFEQLQEEIDGITESTRYNGQSLLNGTSDFADDTVESAPTALTGAAGDVTITADTTGVISVNGTEIEIKGEDALDDTLTVDDLVKMIEDGLHDKGVYTIEVENDGSTLTLSSLDKGKDAVIEVKDVSGTINVAALGFTTTKTTGTTTEKETTGADIVVGSTSADTINLSIKSLTTEELGIQKLDANGDGLDVSTEEGAAKALSVLDMAIDNISNARAELGATMSRFEFRSAQIDTSVENLKAAESAIRDVDIAKEQAQLSASTVKVQAAVAAASQANQMPQNLLSLIR